MGGESAGGEGNGLNNGGKKGGGVSVSASSVGDLGIGTGKGTSVGAGGFGGPGPGADGGGVPSVTSTTEIGIAGIDKVTSIPEGPKDTRSVLGRAVDFAKNNPVTSLLGGLPGTVALSLLGEETQASLGLDPGGVAGSVPDFVASSKTAVTPAGAPIQGPARATTSAGEGAAPTPTTPRSQERNIVAPLPGTKKLTERERRARAVSRTPVFTTAGGTRTNAVASLLGE